MAAVSSFQDIKAEMNKDNNVMVNNKNKIIKINIKVTMEGDVVEMSDTNTFLIFAVVNTFGNIDAKSRFLIYLRS